MAIVSVSGGRTASENRTCRETIRARLFALDMTSLFREASAMLLEGRLTGGGGLAASSRRRGFGPGRDRAREDLYRARRPSRSAVLADPALCTILHIRRLLISLVIGGFFFHGCATSTVAPITTHRHDPFARMVIELAEAIGWDPETIRVAEVKTREKEPISEINAASLGDRKFYVTRGFIDAATRDRCVGWGVLAHEFAHDELGHVTSRQVASAVTSVIGSAVGMFIPGGGYAVQAVAFPALRAYGRHHEREADQKAVEILRKAARPPGAMRWTLERLQTPGREGGGGWLGTHPALAERVDALPKMPWEEGWKECLGQSASPLEYRIRGTPTPVEAIGRITEQVNTLAAQGVLDRGGAEALTATLQAAIQQLNQWQVNAAGNLLQAFVAQVNAFVSDPAQGALLRIQGLLLINAANEVVGRVQVP